MCLMRGIIMHMQEVEVAADVEFGEVAAMCEGYSGDDVTNICRDAAMNGMRTLIAGKTPDQIRCQHLFYAECQNALICCGKLPSGSMVSWRDLQFSSPICP